MNASSLKIGDLVIIKLRRVDRNYGEYYSRIRVIKETFFYHIAYVAQMQIMNGRHCAITVMRNRIGLDTDYFTYVLDESDECDGSVYLERFPNLHTSIRNIFKLYIIMTPPKPWDQFAVTMGLGAKGSIKWSGNE
jgi:hypothetical protein